MVVSRHRETVEKATEEVARNVVERITDAIAERSCDTSHVVRPTSRSRSPAATGLFAAS
jgi:hypothetical protein